MNATSAEDGCPIPRTHIPGSRRPGSRMKRVHTTTKKNPQQEGNPHDSPEPTEDPTTPKAKGVCPTFRAENLQTDEDNSEIDEIPSIPNFLFSSSTIPGSVSQTSFGHISINSLTIITVSKATESPQEDLSIDASHVLRQSIMAEILSRSTGNHHVTVY